MNKKMFRAIVIAVILFSPIFTLAETCYLPGQTLPPLPPDFSPRGSQNAPGWINCVASNIITSLLWVIFAGLIIIMSIIAGTMFLTARGDETKISTAKKMMIWIVVGIIVGLIAFSIERIIRSLLSVNS